MGANPLIEKDAHFIDMEGHLSFLPKLLRERLPEATLQNLPELARRVTFIHVPVAHGARLREIWQKFLEFGDEVQEL
jgi:hypothetical protein